METDQNHGYKTALDCLVQGTRNAVQESDQIRTDSIKPNIDHIRRLGTTKMKLSIPALILALASGIAIAARAPLPPPRPPPAPPSSDTVAARQEGGTIEFDGVGPEQPVRNHLLLTQPPPFQKE